MAAHYAMPRITRTDTLIAKENTKLRKAAKAATERKSCKRKYVCIEETLTVREVLNLIAPKDVGGEEGGKKAAKRVQGKRRCGRCSKGRRTTS